MDIDDIIYQLIDLRQNAEYQAQHDDDQLWQDDIKALNAAIEIIRKYQQAGGYPDKQEDEKQSDNKQNNHGASATHGITRFQNIKQMTVEEIAEGLNLICDCLNDCSSCPFHGNCPPLGFHDIGGWIEWLESDDTDAIDDDPAVDVEYVIRCNDCRHWTPDKDIPGDGICNLWDYGSKFIQHTQAYDYCSKGERR